MLVAITRNRTQSEVAIGKKKFDGQNEIGQMHSWSLRATSMTHNPPKWRRVGNLFVIMTKDDPGFDSGVWGVVVKWLGRDLITPPKSENSEKSHFFRRESEFHVWTSVGFLFFTLNSEMCTLTVIVITI
jgi:hypothetical protein